MEARLIMSDLIGMVFEKIEGLEIGSSRVVFHIENRGRKVEMVHQEECCEQVEIVDICGDVNDLLNTPILVAEQRCSDAHEHNRHLVPEELSIDDSAIWTFYEFRTIKGSVTIRWLGTSNGFYGVQVDLYWYR